MRKLRLMLVSLAFTSACANAQALTSRDFSVMGRVTWAAFECSVLAGEFDDRAEQQRLFLLGYEQGTQFIVAVREGKVDQSDVRGEVPIGLTLVLQGPTPDFILGRAFEYAQEEALKGVLTTNGELNSEDVKSTLAQSRYTTKNCAILRAVK